MDVTMPQLGETVTEGTITRWFKEVGERVEVDESLFEVSTDKVDSEVPSPGAGVLTEIVVPEGETVAVGVRLAVLGDAGEATATEAASESESEPEPGLHPVPDPPSDPEEEPVSRPPGEPARPARLPEADPDPDGEHEPEPPPEAASASPSRVPGSGSGQVTSPIVRRLLAERGLDPASIPGTGEGGRITRRDVLAAADDRGANDADAAAVPGPQEPAPASGPTPRASREEERIPFDNIRRRTAEHMVASKATSAHVYTSVEVDFERIERVRRVHREAWRDAEGFSLTYLPFVIRATCDALAEFPRVNASVEGETLVVHHEVHLGVAVDLDFEGLLAPVIRDADGKRLRTLARSVRDLAERARTRRLSPDEVLGGTFTITNPGPFGSFMTLPIINQPQVAILSTDGIAKRPVVVDGPDGEDTIAVHHTGVLTLAWDHRAFDGAYASSFLLAVKEILEHRGWEPELA